MQTTRTPQITFGIKHSPLLGQLKPLTPQPQRKEIIKNANNVTERNTITNQEIITNGHNMNHNVNDINDSRIEEITKTQVTKIRNFDNDSRSCTVTPEPIQETIVQDIVWVPESRVRRGSYTIEKSDGSGFTERFQNNEIVPLENGVRHATAVGERSATCTAEHSSKVIQREGMEQKVERNVKNAMAQERNQTASEEVRTSAATRDVPGGTATITTTTTVRKVGTAAKTATESTSATRTSTVITSRDVGTK